VKSCFRRQVSLARHKARGYFEATRFFEKSRPPDMQDETPPGGETPAEKPKYDQAFFLALALQGKDEWNKWRRDPANERERAIFVGVDFSKAPWDQIDFAGFEFGYGADFSGCIWRGIPWQFGDRFEAGYGFGFRFDPKAFRPGRASFIGATFGSHATFNNACFGEEAFFDRVTFDHHALFSNANFGDGASFNKTVFGAWARFDYATFGAGANFDGATFGSYAAFHATAFGYGASFDGANFQGSVFFVGDSRPIEKNEDPENPLKQRHRRLWEHRGSGPDRFRSISFANAQFSGGADFSSRKFESVVDFSNARFFTLPIFDNVTNVAQIDFTGTRLDFVLPGQRHWTFNSQIPIRFRALRKIAEETKNPDLERDLYIEERKAERGVYLCQRLKELGWSELKTKLNDINKQPNAKVWKWWHKTIARMKFVVGITTKPREFGRLITHILWIGIMAAYWALADYGRSIVQPLAWLIASGFFSYWCYGKIFAPLAPKAGALADQYDHAVKMLALGNTVPFIGPLTIDSKVKEFLLCPSGDCPAPIMPPDGYQWLVLSQNLLSIILVFFIGLALRNYFKIK
jgi:uncharacterized protein YjbI with pentapeptide repeats